MKICSKHIEQIAFKVFENGLNYCILFENSFNHQIILLKAIGMLTLKKEGTCNSIFPQILFRSPKLIKKILVMLHISAKKLTNKMEFVEIYLELLEWLTKTLELQQNEALQNQVSKFLPHFILDPFHIFERNSIEFNEQTYENMMTLYIYQSNFLRTITPFLFVANVKTRISGIRAVIDKWITKVEWNIFIELQRKHSDSLFSKIWPGSFLSLIVHFTRFLFEVTSKLDQKETKRNEELMKCIEKLQTYFEKHFFVSASDKNWLHIFFELVEHEDDDVLIQTVLDLFLLFQYSQHLDKVSGDIKNTFLDHFEPNKLFSKLLDKFGNDDLLLVDFLISNETNFLEMILRYLRLSGQGLSASSTEIKAIRRTKIKPVLDKLNQHLTKMQKKNLFPYNVAPLIKLLNRYEH